MLFGNLFRRTAAALILAASPMLPQTASATEALTSGWEGTNLEQAELMRIAELSLRAAGFTQNFEKTETTFYGWKGQYTALIRCVAAKGIVFFVISGPDQDGRDGLCTKIRGQLTQRLGKD